MAHPLAGAPGLSRSAVASCGAGFQRGLQAEYPWTPVVHHPTVGDHDCFHGDLWSYRQDRHRRNSSHSLLHGGDGPVELFPGCHERCGGISDRQCERTKQGLFPKAYSAVIHSDQQSGSIWPEFICFSGFLRLFLLWSGYDDTSECLDRGVAAADPSDSSRRAWSGIVAFSFNNKVPGSALCPAFPVAVVDVCDTRRISGKSGCFPGVEYCYGNESDGRACGSFSLHVFRHGACGLAVSRDRGRIGMDPAFDRPDHVQPGSADVCRHYLKG